MRRPPQRPLSPVWLVGDTKERIIGVLHKYADLYRHETGFLESDMADTREKPLGALDQRTPKVREVLSIFEACVTEGNFLGAFVHLDRDYVRGALCVCSRILVVT